MAPSSPMPMRHSPRMSTASPDRESNESERIGNFPFELNPREIFCMANSISAVSWNGNDC